MAGQKMDGRRIVVALDFAEAAAARALLERLDPTRCRVKIGKELFTAAGPDFVREAVDKGFDVFLDLKFHDIPNTVAKAVAAACELGVWMVNVHASGGSAMMHAAREAVQAASHRPLLIAVTVLTSMSAEDLAEIGLQLDPAEQVRQLAALARDSGMDGVVCSAAEAQMLHKQMGQQFVLVTPGIRDASDASGDQKRIVTPEDAIAAGSHYLVIGRPITAAADPAARLTEISSRLHGAFPDLC